MGKLRCGHILHNFGDLDLRIEKAGQNVFHLSSFPYLCSAVMYYCVLQELSERRDIEDNISKFG